MDPVAVARWANHPRTATPWLHEEVGQRMAQRLDWIKATPAAWLHWEPVNGSPACHHALAQRYPSAQAWVWAQRPDVAQTVLRHHALAQQKWWARWRYTPPPVWMEGKNEVGLVWANMVLHQTHLPQTLMAHWHRVLQVNGFVMFSCLGPDSLRELHAVHAQMGWPPPAHACTDMHDWGDMLVQTGFAEPVMDMERIVLTFSTSHALLDELRVLGRNLSSVRATRPRSKAWLEEWHRSVEKHMPRDAQGRLALTFEIVYGHAHKGQPKVPLTSSSAISLRDMKQLLSQGKNQR